MVRDLIGQNPQSSYYVSVDEEDTIANNMYSLGSLPAAIFPPQNKDAAWLQFQWQEVRNRAAQWLNSGQNSRNDVEAAAFVFAIDEVQKIEQWSNIVKGLWDADRANGVPMHVVLLGSAPMLMQKGLSESLAGRYEVMTMSHWGFTEMQEAFVCGHFWLC